MSCAIDYFAIFEKYGELLHKLFTYHADVSAVVTTPPPFPVHGTTNEYDADTTSSFKGMLIWDAQRYYSGKDMLPVDSDNTNDAVIHFFVVPNFGATTVVPNVEYKQRITMLFDSNSNPDSDPYGFKIARYIDWFINANTELVTANDGYFALTDDAGVTIRRLYIMLDSISEPIYTRNSIYVRKAVNITLRYCRCG